MFDALRQAGFDIMVRNHAEAILSVDFPNETKELTEALLRVSIPAQELIASGGGEAKSTQRLRRELDQAGWRKHHFRIQTTLDGIPLGDGTSHEIDHIRRAPAGTLALEIEWNNKDPFFDRDLENFQRLHAQGIISAGIIVTRGSDLQATMTARIEDCAVLRVGQVRPRDDPLGQAGGPDSSRRRKSLSAAVDRPALYGDLGGPAAGDTERTVAF